MKVAVLGLGVEGLRAAESLKRRGHSVYASDIREDVNADLEEWMLTLDSMTWKG